MRDLEVTSSKVSPKRALNGFSVLLLSVLKREMLKAATRESLNKEFTSFAARSSKSEYSIVSTTF